jgi:hypothetical protein
MSEFENIVKAKRDIYGILIDEIADYVVNNNSDVVNNNSDAVNPSAKKKKGKKAKRDKTDNELPESIKEIIKNINLFASDKSELHTIAAPVIFTVPFFHHPIDLLKLEIKIYEKEQESGKVISIKQVQSSLHKYENKLIELYNQVIGAKADALGIEHGKFAQIIHTPNNLGENASEVFTNFINLRKRNQAIEDSDIATINTYVLTQRVKQLTDTPTEEQKKHCIFEKPPNKVINTPVVGIEQLKEWSVEGDNGLVNKGKPLYEKYFIECESKKAADTAVTETDDTTAATTATTATTADAAVTETDDTTAATTAVEGGKRTRRKSRKARKTRRKKTKKRSRK